MVYNAFRCCVYMNGRGDVVSVCYTYFVYVCIKFLNFIFNVFVLLAGFLSISYCCIYYLVLCSLFRSAISKINTAIIISWDKYFTFFKRLWVSISCKTINKLPIGVVWRWNWVCFSFTSNKMQLFYKNACSRIK